MYTCTRDLSGRNTGNVFRKIYNFNSHKHPIYYGQLALSRLHTSYHEIHSYNGVASALNDVIRERASKRSISLILIQFPLQ